MYFSKISGRGLDGRALSSPENTVLTNFHPRSRTVSHLLVEAGQVPLLHFPVVSLQTAERKL